MGSIKATWILQNKEGSAEDLVLHNTKWLPAWLNLIEPVQSLPLKHSKQEMDSCLLKSIRTETIFYLKSYHFKKRTSRELCKVLRKSKIEGINLLCIIKPIKLIKLLAQLIIQGITCLRLILKMINWMDRFSKKLITKI